MNAPLTNYARWHVAETLPRLLTPLGLFTLLAGLNLWQMIAAVGIDAMREVGSPENAGALGLYRTVLLPSMTLGAIALASGWPSLDRERQYFRFYFSHPVAPAGFYLQKFVIAVFLFALAMMIIPLGFGLFIAPVPVLAVGVSSWLYALLYGSLALLCAALLNRDGILFIAIILVGNVLQQAANGLPPWVATVSDMLPPFQKADDLRSALLAGTSMDSGDLVHVALYSLGMLAGALVLVRRAPLAR